MSGAWCAGGSWVWAGLSWKEQVPETPAILLALCRPSRSSGTVPRSTLHFHAIHDGIEIILRRNSKPPAQRLRLRRVMLNPH